MRAASHVMGSGSLKGEGTLNPEPSTDSVRSRFKVQGSGFKVLGLLFFLATLPCTAPAADLSGPFDAANKLYEQGRFAEAAAAYDKLLPEAAGSAALWFNLGNAHYKAGQNGRALAAWRQAEGLAPRDAGVRFNLAFVRKRVTGAESAPGPFWQRALRTLTLNEWTVMVAVGLWLWCGLLALREFRPALRRTLSGYTATAGAGALLLAACLTGAAATQWSARPAVVVAPEAIVRSGPLDEAKTLHQFRDGTEVQVLDAKSVGSQAAEWLQIQDAAGRTGWAKADQLVRLKNPFRR